MVTNCRMCASAKLRQFIDLGFTPLADAFLRADQMQEPEPYYPLQVHQCEDCGLAQLAYVVSPDLRYRHDYPYESSITRAGRRHWKEFADSVCSRLALTDRDLVIDVGSNVGVLLECFRNNGTRILGIDPATNIVRIAEKRGVETWDEYFGSNVVERILRDKGKAKVITATNVFTHVDDLRDFMSAVNALLEDDGVFILEAPHFGRLLQSLEYDTIYHEHVSYLSLRPLQRFVSECAMEVFDVQERDIHGGSFRAFVSRPGRYPAGNSVRKMLAWESGAGLYDAPVLDGFPARVAGNRTELMSLLRNLKRQGKRIAGVSAPAKGMTLLNYCHIGPELLDFVTEKSQLKIGRYTPGMHIPVLDDNALIRNKADYALLLAWNFAEEIMGNLEEFELQGGQFILPIPKPRIVARAWTTRHAASPRFGTRDL
jgi:SAM-dependent methyltransferase